MPPLSLSRMGLRRLSKGTVANLAAFGQIVVIFFIHELDCLVVKFSCSSLIWELTLRFDLGDDVVIGSVF